MELPRLRAERVLEELRTQLSFDRPICKEKMVEQVRDFLLAVGYPVANDWRKRDSYYAELPPYLRKEIGVK